MICVNINLLTTGSIAARNQTACPRQGKVKQQRRNRPVFWAIC
jgi:hypothetical protein